jgi:hypothetical protein
LGFFFGGSEPRRAGTPPLRSAFIDLDERRMCIAVLPDPCVFDLLHKGFLHQPCHPGRTLTLSGAKEKALWRDLCFDRFANAARLSPDVPQ